MSGDPLWIDAITGTPAYAANEMRQAMALSLLYGGRLLGARAGVRPGGDALKVSLAGSTITVQPGVMCVDPALSTPQGPYWSALPAAETHTLTAADGTNPRKDIIQARVYDGVEDGSGLRIFRTDYKVGIPAPSPAEPTLDTGAVKLALIDVPQSGGGSPVVTDTRPWTVAAGALLPVRNQTERDAVSAFDSLAVYRLDRNWVEIHDGTAWRVVGIAVASSSSDLTTGVTNPYNHQMAYRSDLDMLQRWNGSAWVHHPDVLAVELTQAAIQTLTNNVWTSITFGSGSEDEDTHGAHSTSSNTSRVTPPRAGLYVVSGGVGFSNHATGKRWVRLAKNGTEHPGTGTNAQATATGQHLQPARTKLIRLNGTTDYVEIQALQDSGGGLDTYVAVAFAASSLSVHWLRP